MNLGLIVAAGRGYRLGGPVPKQYLSLSHIPILARTATALLRHPGLQAVQVLIHPDDRDLYDAAVAGLDLPPPLLGGAKRQDSVRLGLEGVAGLNPDKVLIHDGVRPFVAAETITAVLDALDRVPAAIAAIPVTDTLKRGEGGRVTGTVDRTGLWRAQTPQGFRFRDILAAHRQVHAAPLPGPELTDDAMLAERVGMEVALVLGHEDNIKITTEPDLHRAEAMLRSRG
ncbi:2-C-methyl-D-erythritol 4-phosphate cytidylyltransferase [Belnapia sp. T6]|uniref:2-C-methyl-D-erythritol 4-phosphate cytidylyltransferase n=1 Tax=Belnapia mucosa TaxID=2804532 RepID=A0ABS1VAQ2_9PROT|nr:2-C-methyl-D-erythritol 4-phosphate cytidylyltransferase [Belnapia mucosa]MBL6458754.1 2-C-methyl-D-erythritol 4-phosphate cytidylyltransferase [Belnapia mucosa]